MIPGRPPNVVERGLQLVLTATALAILIGAFVIMLGMDAGSRGQGGRFYVAIAAVFALGAVDSQILKVARRHWPLQLGVSSQERRYALVSMVLLLLCALVLIGFGFLYP